MSKNADILLEQAAEALKNKQYANAEVLQRQACELIRGERLDDSRLATEIEKLADIHCIQKKFDECASEYAEAVRLREKFLPENDFEILRPLYRLAKSHFEGQKYDSAEAEMRRALSLAESRKDLPESVAFTLYELGWLLYYVGKYREAEPYLIRALSICEETHGATPNQTIQVLGRIALLYANCPDLGKEPEPYFRRVIEATKSATDMQETYLTNLCRLACYIAEQKRLAEADELFLQLLSLLNDSTKLSDSDNHWIIRSCVKHFQSRGKGEVVAHLLPEKQDYNVYGDMVQKRLEHAAQTLSQDDPEFAEALLAAGNNATFEGKYQEAEPLLTRALDACMKIHGERSSQTVFALNRVCIIKRLLGKFDEAESAIQRAVDGARVYLSDQGLYPWTLENLALLREAEAKTDDAESKYAEAVAEYEKICGFPSYETVEALYHQSGCLLRMGKLGPAEAAIRRAISDMDKIDTLSGYEKSDYLLTLASILEATGRNAEGKETRNRAERLFEQAKQQNESEA
jgi:tetratricopeptide (TPR) repeat protein